MRIEVNGSVCWTSGGNVDTTMVCGVSQVLRGCYNRFLVSRSMLTTGIAAFRRLSRRSLPIEGKAGTSIWKVKNRNVRRTPLIVRGDIAKW